MSLSKWEFQFSNKLFHVHAFLNVSEIPRLQLVLQEPQQEAAMVAENSKEVMIKQQK